MRFQPASLAIDARDSAVSNFKRGMRRLASGISIIATNCDGVRYGLVATTVTSVTDAPPTLLVCVNRSASIRPALREGCAFSVNLLSSAQAGLIHRFTDPRYREERFLETAWQDSPEGPPVLSDAEASLTCKIRKMMDYGSHCIVFGEVTNVRVGLAAPDPLVWLDGGSHRLSGVLQ